MTIHAIKTNSDSKIVFDLPGMTEPEAIKYAKDSLRKTFWDNFKKRFWGWTFKVK